MRLFLINRNKGFSNKDVVKRSRVSREIVRRELTLLSNIGFIKKRATSWFFDSSFKYTPEINNLLINTDTLDKDAIIDKARALVPKYPGALDEPAFEIGRWWCTAKIAYCDDSEEPCPLTKVCPKLTRFAVV